LSCLYYALQIADIQYTMWCYYLNNRTWVNCEILSLLKSWSWNFDALDGYRLFSRDRCRVQNWNWCFMHMSAENSPTKTHCFVSSSENYPFKNSLFWNWLDWLKLLEIVSLTKFQNLFFKISQLCMVICLVVFYDLPIWFFSSYHPQPNLNKPVTRFNVTTYQLRVTDLEHTL